MEEAIPWVTKFQQEWLFSRCGLDERIWNKHQFRIGETIYTTQTCKCPTEQSLTRKDIRSAFERCKPYLEKELNILKPRAVIAFGHEARKAVEKWRGIRWAAPVRILSMKNEARVREDSGCILAVLPDPTGAKRNHIDMNPMVDYVFSRVRGCLSTPRASSGASGT
jgi:uracil-DNA glycosylase